MPFKFSWLCELLEELYQQRHLKRATNAKNDCPHERLVELWFQRFDTEIERCGPSAIALLSSLLPERRPDRVYNVQENRLSQIFGRALGLGSTRARTLLAWKERDGVDFPTCVERVMSECEFDPPRNEDQVTLEEIDVALDQIAANSPYSSPTLKARADSRTISELVAPIIRRLRSWEAKWFVRMLLKSYSPSEIPECVALHEFHFMLPKLLSIQNSLEAAVTFLERPEISALPPRPTKDYEAALQSIVAQYVRPQLGIMIKRQPYWKARSIKHCMEMARGRVMSVERKYDGEYCQIHVDMSKEEDCIQIFSKSGKNSTLDREALHEVIATSLGLAQPWSKVRTSCILEGELLVWGEDENRILPFYKIRKHVKHGGRFLGTEQDSPYSLNERLIIVFYDVLMLNDEVLLNEKHDIRRSTLKALVREEEGHAQVVERCLIDFKTKHASKQLREAFASCIVKRWEGFVLKGVEDPYFSWKEDMHGIKLKKDYIAGLGDVADLCIVGGRRDPKVETQLGIGKLSWTTFHVGCLLNKSNVQRYGTKPVFRIVDVLSHHSLTSDDIKVLNLQGNLVEIPYSPNTAYLNVKVGSEQFPRPTELFKKPFIVEILGSGFERQYNANYWVLRFPRKNGARIKIHLDRDITHSMDFGELQALAVESINVPSHSDCQEDRIWIEKLLAADPVNQYLDDRSQSTSPGKTPKSAITASLSPIGSRKRSCRRAPVLIRTDSIEMIPTESEDRCQKIANRASTTKAFIAANASKDVIKSLKRKACDSPIAHTTCEYCNDRRLSSVTWSSNAIEKTPNTSAATTDSTCLRDPLVSGGKRVQKSSALSEIKNVALDRIQLPSRTNKGNAYNGSPRLGPRTQAVRLKQKYIRNGKTKPTHVARVVTPLRAACSPRLPYEVPIRHSQRLLPFKPPILVGPSVAKNALACHDVIQVFRQTQASFTFSIVEFVDDVMLRPTVLQKPNSMAICTTRPVHMLLTNSENSVHAKRDLRQLAKEFLKQYRDRAEHREPLILVFDYKVLDRIKPPSEQPSQHNSHMLNNIGLCTTDDAASRHLFCGIANIHFVQGGGWCGNDAFSYEMKWDWNSVYDLMRGNDIL